MPETAADFSLGWSRALICQEDTVTFKQQAVEAADRVIEMAIRWVEREDEVPMTAFFLVPEDGEEELRRVFLPLPEEKEAAVEATRCAAETIGAMYVLLLAQGWRKQTHDSAEMQGVLAQAAMMGMKEVEGAEHVVMLLVSGPDVQRTYLIPFAEDGTTG